MIPKVFHRIWIGGTEPGWLRDCAATWVEHHPAWQVRQWGDVEAETLFPLEHHALWDEAPSIVDVGHLQQFRADLLRYTILWRHGGLYVDADFTCLRPIDGLIGDASCVSAWEVEGKWAVNGFLGAEPAHPFIGRLLDGLPWSVQQNRGKAPTVITGPQFLTRCMNQAPALERPTVLPQACFFPFQPSIGDVKAWPLDLTADELRERAPEAYGVHWWRNRRRKAGMLTDVE